MHLHAPPRLAVGPSLSAASRNTLSKQGQTRQLWERDRRHHRPITPSPSHFPTPPSTFSFQSERRDAPFPHRPVDPCSPNHLGARFSPPFASRVKPATPQSDPDRRSSRFADHRPLAAVSRPEYAPAPTSSRHLGAILDRRRSGGGRGRSEHHGDSASKLAHQRVCPEAKSLRGRQGVPSRPGT